jgi:hypothetical protein
VLRPLREHSQARLNFRVVRGEWREHADAPHGEWVRRCATESSDEIAAPHGLRSPAERQAETLLTIGPMSFSVPKSVYGAVAFVPAATMAARSAPTIGSINSFLVIHIFRF